MLTLKITIKGATESDLELALEALTEKVCEGYRGGGDSNDTGSYNFDITDEEEECGEPV